MSHKVKRNSYSKRNGKFKEDDSSDYFQKGRNVEITVYWLGAIATVGMVLFGIFYHSHKVPSIWLFGVSVVCMDLAGCLLWQQKIAAAEDNPPLSVAMLTTLQGETRNAGMLIAMMPPVYFPIPLAGVFRITNREDHPITIRRFTVDLQVKRGNWIVPPTWVRAARIFDDTTALGSINHQTGQVFQAELIGGRLFPQIENRPIQPHQTVTGWALFDFGKEYDGAPRPLTYRIRVEDTEGNGATHVTRGADGAPDATLMSTVGVRSEGVIDLNGYRLEHLADLRDTK